MLIEIKDKGAPISYANAFAKPAAQGERDLVSESIAQLAQYVHDLDTGYGKPKDRFWFSPNLRYSLTVVREKEEVPVSERNFKSLGELVSAVIGALGHDWEAVQKVVVNSGVAS